MTQIARQISLIIVTTFTALSFLPGALSAAERDRIEAFLTTTGFDVALESIALVPTGRA